VRECKPFKQPAPPPSAILTQAKQAVYDGKEQLAVDITSQMLQVTGDPEEAQVWAVRGSAYCRMGKKSKAKSCWERAYEIDPCMKDIPETIKHVDEACKPR
jgi:hypothetical protein